MNDKKFNTLSLITSITALVISLASVYFQFFYIKNAAKDRKRAKYGDRSLKKAFR